MRRWFKYFSVLFVLISVPVVQAEKISGLDAGWSHTCLLSDIGAVMCWGLNSDGEIGDGSTSNRLVPVTVTGLNNGVKAVAAGGHNTCALTNGGAVFCWGNDIVGQLGAGVTGVNALSPSAVTGLSSGVKTISMGVFSACALKDGGKLLCWGSNTGDGSQASRATPVVVSGLDNGVVAITSGFSHSCALTSAGSVLCWGNNQYGQLGNNSTVMQSAPVQVSGLTSDVTAIAAGDYHTCALTGAGAVFCWGNNQYGQLGDNSTLQKLTPVSVNGLGSGVLAIAAGAYHTCALAYAGNILCWGNNQYGQLGDGSSIQKLAPVTVNGLVGQSVVTVAAGGAHTCTITTGGAGICWGQNSAGQLGINNLDQQLLPVWITGFDDTDGDGVTGSADAFPENASASVDADHDGFPDFWLEPNPFSCSPAATTCNGLTLDSNPPPMILNNIYKGSSIRESLSRP